MWYAHEIEMTWFAQEANVQASPVLEFQSISTRVLVYELNCAKPDMDEMLLAR